MRVSRDPPESISQRNYVTVANLLHERIQEHQEVCSQLAAERNLTEELRAQLAAANGRAEGAGQQLQLQLRALDELQLLRDEAALLRAAQEDGEQQCAVLHDQLSRVKQDLYAAMSAKQAALQMLQERDQQLAAVSNAASSMKQQLEEHVSGSRTQAAQLVALKEEHQHNKAQVKELTQQLSAAQSRLKAVEEAGASGTTHSTQLKAQLADAQASLRAAASKLQQLQISSVEATERLKHQTDALGEEQAARRLTDQKVEQLQAQLAGAQARAEAAERQQQADATRSALFLSRAQKELEDARAAQIVAEEAHHTADAAAKLLAQKITEVQRQAAQQQGVADATKQELSNRNAALMQQLELGNQQQQGWQFRQLELLVRAVSKLESLEGRCGGDGPAAALVAAVQQHEAELHAVTTGLDECMVALCDLTATGSKVETAISKLQQHQFGMEAAHN